MRYASQPYPRLRLLEQCAAAFADDEPQLVRFAELLRQANLDTITVLRQTGDNTFADTIRIREAEIAGFDRFIRAHQH